MSYADRHPMFAAIRSLLNVHWSPFPDTPEDEWDTQAWQVLRLVQAGAQKAEIATYLAQQNIEVGGGTIDGSACMEVAELLLKLEEAERGRSCGDGRLACDREFITEHEGVERRVVVEWMTPERDRGDWRCDWRIHGLGDDPKHGCTFGVDSTQAILLAFARVRAFIEHETPTIRWLSQDDGLGLPSLLGHEGENASEGIFE